MLKRRGPALTLVALFVLAVYGVSVSPRPYRISPPIKKTTNYTTTNSPTYITTPDASNERLANYTWWLSFFTLCLVVGQIVFLTRADWATQKTLVLTQRPKLRVAILPLPRIGPRGTGLRSSKKVSRSRGTFSYLTSEVRTRRLLKVFVWCSQQTEACQ
jgi:hypothetical protein